MDVSEWKGHSSCTITAGEKLRTEWLEVRDDCVGSLTFELRQVQEESF